MLRAAALALLAALAPVAAAADTLVAARTIRAAAVIGPEDVALAEGETPGALVRPEQAVGLEARTALYAGRPIRPADLGPPALVERNQTVALAYRSGALSIVTEGRALGRGGVGDTVRVMNIASRSIVLALVRPDGSLSVGGN